MVGEALQHGAFLGAVADRHAQRPDAAEDVELGDRQRVHAVEADRVAEGDEVHPAGAAPAAGGRPELVAALDDPLAGLVLELGREGAGADPGRVGLGDAPDFGDVGRADAGADRRRAGDRVRRGDEGIGAVVEVEQGRLGALEDHRPVGVQGVPAELGGVGDVGLQPMPVVDVFLDHRVQVQARVRHAGNRPPPAPPRLPRPLPCAVCAAAPRARAEPAAWAPGRRGSWFAGSSRRAGPGRGSRVAAPCRRSRGRSRAGWCRSRASPVWSPRPCRGARGRA